MITTTKKFSDYTYSRPDMAHLEKCFKKELAALGNASTFAEAKESFQQIYELRNAFQTMYNLAYIRHSSNSHDAFYEAENSFFDQQTPIFEALKNSFYQAILSSEFTAEFRQAYGAQLFDIAALSLKTFDPAIIEDLQEENRLVSVYNKLKATAQFQFQGKTYNLSSIQPLEENPDRSTRAAAARAKWDWLAKQQPELDRIFDELVKVRHKIAKQLGYENYVELGYARMLRTDYNAQDVAAYREAIRQHIVPLTSWLYDQQRQGLGLETFYYYDEPIKFLEGNAVPQGNPEWIVAKAGQMYAELSAETDDFFRFMQERELMDLVSRDGKATGGYCTFIPNEKAPFIFSNFNGTSGDIDVLTHEAGHAFQVYSSKDIPITEYNWPTYEACEIHSMSMEFFTWPWMNLFFEGEVDRYYYGHLSGAINFLPYGVAVDEFQHYVYENPEATPEMRNAAWLDIEKKYLPHRNYEGHPYLEGGGYWQRQTHIYGMPFYYIDYTLAQICAFQFWQKDQAEHTEAWADYIRLCKAGGSASFLKLVELANLQSPFKEGCVAEMAKAVKEWLEEHPL
ncbi:MAG: M3 family oligoendopeptidase [Bacteroidota bacterium]